MKTKLQIPIFCQTCGYTLSWSKPKRCSFNELTGRPRYIMQRYCPKKKWWQFLHRQPRQSLGLGVSVPYYKITEGK